MELKKIKNGDKKIREYKYMLEHTYGRRGKKTDYSPWSCQKIVQKATPGHDEVYGCPYAYYSREKLENVLKTKGLAIAIISDVLKAKDESPFLACKKVFLALYNVSDTESIKKVSRHPNNYFYTAFGSAKKSIHSISNL